MESQKAATAIFIDKYHPKANGLCSVSIRITYDRKKKYYPTPISLTPIDFEKAQALKARGEFKEIALKLHSYEQKAAEIIDKMPVFTWNSFERQYLTNRAANDTIDGAFANYIDDHMATDRVGTAVSYRCARSSLNKFSPKLRFADVTPELLINMKSGCCPKGTVLLLLAFISDHYEHFSIM